MFQIFLMEENEFQINKLNLINNGILKIYEKKILSEIK